jgi:GTP cyclohydrolase I
MDTNKIATLVRQVLVEIGEDPQREGLLKTPERVAAAYEFLTSGYRTDPERLLNGAVFTQETNSMVIVKNIEVYSLCEHHMLPFFGRCHIGYIPSGRVFGVSKLARLVDMYARRLQLQERLTEQISKQVMELVGAKGVGVMIEAASVHDDARCREAEFGNGHFICARHLSRIHGDSRGVPGTRRGPGAARSLIGTMKRFNLRRSGATPNRVHRTT